MGWVTVCGLGVVAVGGWTRVAGASATGPVLADPVVSETVAEPATGSAAESPAAAPVEAGLDFITVSILATAFFAAVVVVARGLWRPPVPRIARPRTHDGLVALAAAAGTWAFGGLAVMFAAGLPVPEDASVLRRSLPLLTASAIGQSIVALIWWSIGTPFDRRPDRGDERPPVRTGPAITTGLIGLAIAWPITAAVVAIAAIVARTIFGAETETIAHETLAGVAAAPSSIVAILTIVLVTTLVPLIEEVLYRGMIQGGLIAAGLPRLAAVILTAAGFAAMHATVAPMHAVIGLFVMGVGFGLVVERTGRLTSAIVMHAAYNAGNVALALLLT